MLLHLLDLHALLRRHGRRAVGALVEALNRRQGWQLQVEAFDEYSLGDNTEANAMACVRVQVGGHTQSAVALAADTTAAALQAILSAGDIDFAAYLRAPKVPER